jgi:hypothetical protein
MKSLCDFIKRGSAAPENSSVITRGVIFAQILHIQIISQSVYDQWIKKALTAGCSKTSRCKAPEILRSESYMKVRRNDEE